MPHCNALIDHRGALLQVIIGITGARRAALTAAAAAVPAPQLATLLIDTGASHTCVCKSIIQNLALQPTGSMGVNTPSTHGTPMNLLTFDVDIMIPAVAGGLKHLSAMPIIQSDFANQGHQGLIGRDILKEFRMTYSGPDNLVLLSY